MPISVNTNITSMLAQKNLVVNTDGLNRALERLTTGYKINRGSDDPAGLSIAMKMNSEIITNEKAKENIQNAVNLLSTAEGYVNSINDNLQRIRELSNQAANEVYSSDSIQGILTEIDQRLKEIDRLAKSSSFNNQKLLDGSVNSMKIQIGDGSDAVLNTINISAALIKCTTSALGVDLKVVTLKENPTSEQINGRTWNVNAVVEYMKKLDIAINKVGTALTNNGALTNRLNATNDNIVTMNINLAQSKSSIMDADIAQESSNYIKYQILQQTTQTVLTQANQSITNTLSLLS